MNAAMPCLLWLAESALKVFETKMLCWQWSIRKVGNVVREIALIAGECCVGILS